jgi:HTH-type transcriptional regulator / antitoxin HipB
MTTKRGSDLQRSIKKFKKNNPELAKDYDKRYANFKIGVMLRQAREEAGLTQEQLAELTHTKRTAISRLENRTQDVKLSTLENVAQALGKTLELKLA